MPSAKSKKMKIDGHPDYVSLYEIFPWLRGEKLSEAEYKKRQKKRADMEKAHPRAKAKAMIYSATASGTENGKVVYVCTPEIYFIDSADLDKAQRKAYEKWLDGQTRPLIPGVEASSYCSDYNRFREYYAQGRTATIND